MTAEIAIINRSAIALAADSAVTVGKERVWKSTNKLFSLSPINDIGIMIYGAGDFCGVPWDIIIKSYRNKVAHQFETVEECSADFIDYIGTFATPHDEYDNLNSHILLANVVATCLVGIENLQPMPFRQKVKENIKNFKLILSQHKQLNNIVSPTDFTNEYSDIIKNFIKEITNNTITKQIYKEIVKMCEMALNRDIGSNYETGLVFAGYGTSQIFPELVHLVCDGRSNFGIRYWGRGHNNLNTKDSPAAFIVPFAQGDIFHLFVEGIDINYLEFLHDVFSSILSERSAEVINRYVSENEHLVERVIQEKENKAALATFMKEFSRLRKEQTIQPMMTVVRSLPKEEMAAMAEALVEITSLRRRVDSKLESVGGPVDVAVISKGDGFVWIKRKHYFKMDLNSDFAVRRRMRHSWQGERVDG